MVNQLHNKQYSLYESPLERYFDSELLNEMDKIYLQFIRYLMRPSALFAKEINQAVKKVPFDRGLIIA